MSHAVIAGVLLAVETDAILLSGGVRIIIPSTLKGVGDLPIGCQVTVVIERHPGEDPVAVSIKRGSGGFSL